MKQIGVCMFLSLVVWLGDLTFYSMGLLDWNGVFAGLLFLGTTAYAISTATGKHRL